MATALENFVNAVNKTYDHWEQSPLVLARNGIVYCVKWNGFTFHNDPEDDKIIQKELLNE